MDKPNPLEETLKSGLAPAGARSPEDFLEAKLVERMTFIQQRASHVAKRLLEHRDPGLPVPGDAESMMRLVESLMKRRRELGCFLTKPDMKYLAQWHRWVRFKRAEAEKASARADLEKNPSAFKEAP